MTAMLRHVIQFGSDNMYVSWSKDEVSAVIELPEQADGEHFFRLYECIPKREGERIEIYPSSIVEARGLLAYFAKCANAKVTPQVELVEFVARAFERALASDDAAKNLAKEFGLAYWRRGRPKNLARDARVYHRMDILVSSGESVLTAALTCAEEFGIHEANVQKIYYVYRSAIKFSPI